MVTYSLCIYNYTECVGYLSVQFRLTLLCKLKLFIELVSLSVYIITLEGLVNSCTVYFQFEKQRQNKLAVYRSQPVWII